MRLSRFTILLIMAVLMLVGAAVLPLIDVAEQPRERQGRKLTISWSWPVASAKVVEQNVTSRLEGLVSAVKGVAKTESESRFGGGSIVVELKPETSVSAAKFEILSVLRQTYSKLPEGMSYPDLRGGEVVTGRRSRETETKLLTYIVNADMNGRQLSEYISQNVEKQLERNKLIKRTEVSGARDKFIELTYDPVLLSTHGITVGDMETAIRAFMGREDIVGEVVARVHTEGYVRLRSHHHGESHCGTDSGLYVCSCAYRQLRIQQESYDKEAWKTACRDVEAWIYQICGVHTET